MRYQHIIHMLLFASICSCSRCEEDEIWNEKITLGDGSHVMVFHNAECSKSKPLLFPKTKKINYVQMKFDVFDYCFSEEEIEELLAISNFNIHQYEDNFYPEEISDIDNYQGFFSVVDTVVRPYECFYSLKGKTLYPLSEPFRP